MIFLTGATGFLGRQILAGLIEEGQSIKCLVRNKSRFAHYSKKDIETIKGDITNFDSLGNKLLGCDTVIHCAAGTNSLFKGEILKVNLEGTRNLLHASKQQNVRRFIFISSFDTRTASKSCYTESKRLAEDLVKKSHLTYVIIRPSIIYGIEDKKNISRLVEFIKRRKFIPILGSGVYRWQPVYVKDVSKAIVNYALDLGKSNCCINILGPDQLSLNEIVDIISQGLAKKIYKLHIPMLPLKIIGKFLFWATDLCFLDNIVASCIDKVAIQNSVIDFTLMGETSFVDGIKRSYLEGN